MVNPAEMRGCTSHRIPSLNNPRDNSLEIFELILKVFGAVMLLAGAIAVPYRLLFASEVKRIDGDINIALKQSAPVEVMDVKIKYMEKEIERLSDILNETLVKMNGFEKNYLSRFEGVNEQQRSSESKILAAIQEIQLGCATHIAWKKQMEGA